MALAFIDDSGSGGDSAYYVLAGYAGKESQWDSFSRDWQSILSMGPVLQYFKMSEAESLKGQFLGFSPFERDARLKMFINVILDHDVQESSVSVPAADYRAVLFPILHDQHASPYYTSFFAMVTALSGFYRHGGSDEMVDFVFDRQQGMETSARRLYHLFKGWFPNWRLGRVGFCDDKVVLPLQAADLIAWQMRRFMCTTEPVRAELTQLHSRRRPFKQILRRSALIEMADAIKTNIPQLREEFGHERVDRHLTKITKRNVRKKISAQ